MASQLKQIFTASNTGVTNLVVPMGSTTAGSTIIAAVNINQTTDRISGISDGTNNLTKITGASGLIGGSALSYLSVWYVYNNTAQTTPSLTFTKSATCGIEVAIYEYTGLTTTDPLDKTAFGTSVTTAMSSGNTAALTQADELVVGFGADDFGTGQNYTAGSGYGNLNQLIATAGTIAVQDKVVASTTAVSATFTLLSTTDNAASVATFLIAAGGGGGGSSTANTAWLKA